MKESAIRTILRHLRDVEDDFWGTFSVRLRAGQPVAIVKEETIKLDDEDNSYREGNKGKNP